MKISIIAAIGKNRELGKKNKLLWYIPEDMKRFKRLTAGNVVIIGRKTYESLPPNYRPLPNRVNIVVTRNRTYTPLGCIVSGSVEEAIQEAKKYHKEIFIIGGGQIYSQAITVADKLYLTIIDAEFDADTFFPDYSAFKRKVFEEKHQRGKYTYTFVELER